MGNSIQVNDTQIMLKEYNNIRVVTMWDIAKAHGVTQHNVRMNFNNNLKRLIEGEDYYLLGKQEEFVSNLIANKDVDRKAVNRVKDIPIFTETGYLLMTKPMSDDLSWSIQRQLVNNYFKAKNMDKGVNETEVPKIEIEEKAPLQSLSEVNRSIELIKGMFVNMKIRDDDKLKIISKLLNSAGVEVPEVKIKDRKDITYISLEAIAVECALIDRNGMPNLQRALSYICEVADDINDVDIIVKESKEGGYWFSVKFNLTLIYRVIAYLKSNVY